MAALPAGVLGPVECCAFRRLASCCFSEIIIYGICPFVRWSGGTKVPRGVNPALRFHTSGRVLRKRGAEEGGGLVSGLVGGDCGEGIFLSRRVTGGAIRSEEHTAELQSL